MVEPFSSTVRRGNDAKTKYSTKKAQRNGEEAAKEEEEEIEIAHKTAIQYQMFARAEMVVHSTRTVVHIVYTV